MHDWDHAEEFAARAEHLLALGRGLEAEQSLRQAIDIDPSRGEWHAALASVLESLGRNEEGLASMRQAVALLPGDPRPLAASAEFCLRLGRLDEALELTERAIDAGEVDERCHAIHIAILHQLDRVDDAEVVYFEAQQAFEEMPFCLMAIAGDVVAQHPEQDALTLGQTGGAATVQSGVGEEIGEMVGPHAVNLLAWQGADTRPGEPTSVSGPTRSCERFASKRAELLRVNRKNEIAMS